MKFIVQLSVLVAFFLSFFSNSSSGEMKKNIPVQVQYDTIPGGPGSIKKITRQSMFAGGMDSLRRFIAANLLYPDSALKYEIEATVNVRFTIDKNGAVRDVHLKPNDPVPGYGILEEAIRVISSMPRWEPALLKGKPVASYKILPVIFRMEGENAVMPANE